MIESITHDEKGRRFLYSVEGHECSAEYDLRGATIDVFRTFVPVVLRGRGIAEKLLVRVSEFAREKKMSVIPSCSYAVIFYRRHPEYADVLANGVNLENGGSCRVPGR